MFFFQQDTAYEMRISDWSSDVCPSDLAEIGQAEARCARRADRGDQLRLHRWRPALDHFDQRGVERVDVGQRRVGLDILGVADQREVAVAELDRPAGRSEEHTSELQSLMRISYAVFCLKKKNTKTSERIIDGQLCLPQPPTQH